MLNVSNKVLNFTNVLPKATAIFYGTVSNNSTTPGTATPNLYLYASDSAGRQSFGMTDKNGNYVVGVVGGTNQWQFGIMSTNNPGLTNNCVFSPGYVQTNLNAGQAVQINFVILSAPYQIQGSVLDVNGNPIAGVQLNAMNGNYQAFTVTTASDGTYSLPVSPGTWIVSASTNSLASLGFTNFPPAHIVTIVSAGVSGVNFSILVCGEIQILTTNLPNAMVGSPYSTTLQATSCGSVTNWSTAYGITLTSLNDQTNITYPAGTVIFSGGIVGYLLSDFSYGLTDQQFFSSYLSNCVAGNTVTGDSSTTFYDISATVNVSTPIASNSVVTINGKSWTTTTDPSQQGSGVYQTTLFRPGGSKDEFTGKGSHYSASSGMLMSGGGPSNTIASLIGNFHSIATAGNSVNVPLLVPFTGSNNVAVWIQTGTNLPGEYLITTNGSQTTNLNYFLHGISLRVGRELGNQQQNHNALRQN